MINPALEAGVHQTSSFTAEPDEPATRVLCTVEREEPTLSGRVGRETEGNSTGEKSGQAGLASAHRQTGRGSPRRSHSAKMQKRGVPPAGASGSPPLSPQLRRTRARRAHPPHTSARLRGSPRPEDPRAAAPTYPATRTAHRGPRTAAASCRTWSPAGLLPSAGGGRKGPRRVRIPNFLGASHAGWRRPPATAPRRLRAAARAEWARLRCDGAGLRTRTWTPSNVPLTGTRGQLPPLCRLRRLLRQPRVAAAAHSPLLGALSNRRGCGLEL